MSMGGAAIWREIKEKKKKKKPKGYLAGRVVSGGVLYSTWMAWSNMLGCYRELKIITITMDGCIMYGVGALDIMQCVEAMVQEKP